MPCEQLSGGTLDGSTLHVTADNLSPEEAEEKPRGSEHPDQSEKPRAGSRSKQSVLLNRLSISRLVAAEYLASGYKLADHHIQRMIDFDGKLVLY